MKQFLAILRPRDGNSEKNILVTLASGTFCFPAAPPILTEINQLEKKLTELTVNLALMVNQWLTVNYSQP